MAHGGEQTAIDAAALAAGDPAAIGALCGARGAAVVAYADTAADADADAATDVAAAAFGAFRRTVADAEDPLGLDPDSCLLSAARDAARRSSATPLDEAREREAEAAYARTPATALPADTAARLIEAMVAAAPVPGEPEAVRAEAERVCAGGLSTVQDAAGPAPAPDPSERARWLPDQAALADRHAAETPTPRPAPGRLRGLASAPRLPVGPVRNYRAPLLALVVVLGVGGVAVAAVSSDSDEDEPADPVTLTRFTRETFTTGGARFEVQPTTTAQWAREVRQDDPGDGQRWLTIAVQARNLEREGLRPRALGYRLRTQEDLVIGPQTVEIPGDTRVEDGGLLARGDRVSVHLAFTVQEDLEDLRLIFEPAGTAGSEVVVDLGSMGDIRPADRQSAREREAERRETDDEDDTQPSSGSATTLDDAAP